MIKKINIWDLDGTVINSAHRVTPCLRPSGDLDLQKYLREACTHSLIQSDTLLPLVEAMKTCFNHPDTLNAIVTARTMSKSDYYFLRRQGLRGRGNQNVRVHSRDSLYRYFPANMVRQVYNNGDANYKRYYFELIRSQYPDAEITVYDDHQGVLSVAASMGFRAVDATAVNDILMIGSTLIGNEIIEDNLVDDLDVELLSKKLKFAWDCLTEDEQAEYSCRPSFSVLAA